MSILKGLIETCRKWYGAISDYLHLTVMKYEKIPRHDDQPYLDRLIVFRCRWFGILLHKFVGSDDECLHNHPWSFVSFMLKGGYWEWIPARGEEHMYRIDPLRQRTGMASDGTPLTGTWYPRWSLLFRTADCSHRVEYDPDDPAITIVIHGKRTNSWGFDTKHGWKHHTEYNYKEHCA